jgi:cell division protein FtsQ
MKKRYTIKSILITTLWISIGGAVAVLLVAAIRKKDAQHCKGIEINIRGVNNNFFVDKTDILNSIALIADGNLVGKTIGSFNLGMMEKELQKNTWVKSAELFFDNNEILQVSVNEREPVARVFSSAGTSFYIDRDDAMLPLSEKFSARLPVFTNFPSDKMVLSNADSNLLRDIKTISLAIQKDSFRMAMIEQVDITPQRTFEMMPKMGNQVIIFGDAVATEEKFKKLELFYRQVMAKAGWNHYSIINVQYQGQVVAKRRGAEDVTADSLRTLQIMQMIAVNAEKQASDSLQTMLQDNDHNTVDSSLIQQSIQRDAPIESSNPAEANNVIKEDPLPSQKPAMPNKNGKKTIKSKAIMHKRNEYQ